MVDFTITLTDTENKGMEYAANNVADWIDNAASNRARIAVDEIVNLYTTKALDEGVAIPATRDLIVADAPTLSGGGTFASSIRAPIYDTTQNTMKTALFQTNEQTMSTDTTITSTQNASANGPINVASGVTLTVNGNLVIL